MSAPADERNGPEEEGEGFLTRWSRRKRDLAARAAQPPAVPAQEAVDAPPDERPRDPETGEPIDEEFVRTLPSVADIKPGDDLSMFMRKGVPESLRREALRVMWTTDPVIRDYVSPALDYAYDYNAPGGAPGYGPLSESDIAQAKELIDKLFSRVTQPEAAEPGTAQSVSDTESQIMAELPQSALRLSDAAVQQEERVGSDSGAADTGDAPEIAQETSSGPVSAALRRSEGLDRPVTDDEASSLPPPERRRRGGGATPR